MAWRPQPPIRADQRAGPGTVCPARAKPVAVASVSALLLLGMALGAGCGGSDDAGRATAPAETPPSIVAEPPDRSGSPQDSSDSSADDDQTSQTRESEPGRGGKSTVQRAAARYVKALSEGDGAAVCAAMVEGALDDLALPKAREDCAASLDASIGYRDPRGVPVFASAELVAFEGVEVSGREARATATVVTQFADRDEPSIEDDLIYLRRVNGDWRITKASLTLYRAIGTAQVPPDALSPPE